MTQQPYRDLTPERVLDAAAQLGCEPSGRFLALNSYENRVYLVEADSGPGLVLKFYRPDRWSEAQILEEHAFAGELAAAEIPGDRERDQQAGEDEQDAGHARLLSRLGEPDVASPRAGGSGSAGEKVAESGRAQRRARG